MSDIMFTGGTKWQAESSVFLHLCVSSQSRCLFFFPSICSFVCMYAVRVVLFSPICTQECIVFSVRLNVWFALVDAWAWEAAAGVETGALELRQNRPGHRSPCYSDLPSWLSAQSITRVAARQLWAPGALMLGGEKGNVCVCLFGFVHVLWGIPSRFVYW